MVEMERSSELAKEAAAHAKAEAAADAEKLQAQADNQVLIHPVFGR